MRPHSSYLTCHGPSCMYGRRTFLNRTRQRLLRTMYTGLRHEAERCYQISHKYSTSGRGTYKAEAPVGVYAERKAQFQLSFMPTGLGDSFRHVSRHINAYFKPKVPSAFVSALEGRLAGVHKHVGAALSGRASVKDAEFREVQDSSRSQPEKSQVSRAYPGLELFHMSSLVTRFGESYSYVANHINYVFSKKLAGEQTVEVPASEDGLGRSRTSSRVTAINKDNSVEHLNSTDDFSSWEEGYLHFARHINRYFGSKVSDTVKESLQSRSTGSNTSYSMGRQRSSAASHPGSRAQDSHPHRPKSLFHMSNLSTRFGENHAYMATHINHYFKGSAAADEEMERDPYREQPEPRIAQERPLSYIQYILNTSAIPRLVGTYFGMTSSSSATTDTKEAMDRVTVRRRLAEEKTRVLLRKLEKTRARSSFNSCVEELNAHLILHPACKSVVWQEKATMQILKHRRLFGTDEKLQAAIRETLALIGYVDPLKGRGIRVLSIDGGGTRGVVPLQVLKQLEARTGKRVSQLFDYVCGVSTGAVLAFTLALAHFSLEECEEMYRRFGSDVFRQNPFVGTVKMGWSHSYYNTETWEMILKEKIGDQLLIKTARDELCPKVSAVSAVVNWGTSPKPFIFRNYNHSPMRLSRYAGGSGYQLWQAVRASSAAPGYFQEFPLYDDIHQDGGIILNNPSALAVHESRLLWPNQPFQCVLSLGTGRYDNARRGPATSTSLRAKISNLISSATDTEGVHILLADLLEPNVYFRFNPMLSAEVSLDESRPGALHQLQEDTLHYLEQNEPKLKLLCSVLGEERTKLWKTRDWISEKAWELRQHWI